MNVVDADEHRPVFSCRCEERQRGGVDGEAVLVLAPLEREGALERSPLEWRQRALVPERGPKQLQQPREADLRLLLHPSRR